MSRKKVMSLKMTFPTMLF